MKYISARLLSRQKYHPKIELSVVVPVRSLNESHLKQCLNSLQDALKMPSEVIVVEGGNRAQNRNLGLKSARGRYIAFTDSDVEVLPGWPSTLLTYLKENKELAGVGGPSVSHPADPSFAKLLNIIFSTYLGSLHSATFYKPKTPFFVGSLSGSNSVFHTSILVKVGGFDEWFECNEDTNISYKLRSAGYKLLLATEDAVWHHRRTSVYAFLRQMTYYGISRARSFLTDIAYADYRIITGLLLAVFVIISLLLKPFLGILLVLIYVFSCSILCIKEAISRGQWKKGPAAIILLTLMHVSYSIGVIIGLFKGRWKQPMTHSRLALHFYVAKAESNKKIRM